MPIDVGRINQELSLYTVHEETPEQVLECSENVLECPEESVGSLIVVPKASSSSTGQVATNLGCFEWQREDRQEAWEAVPKTRVLGVTVSQPMGTEGDGVDYGSYFTKALDSNHEVFEIAMDIQARDVHKVNGRSGNNWTLNDKPKKRAEVQFRSLSDGDKMDFLKAMKSELSSYLEHEAVAIARRHNVPAERILGMRWVLSWKAVTDDSGETVGKKPKARLIIKGFQDPDLLHLKRDSPTLATQNRNLILALAAAHKWQAYVGDIKTAFLNGDATEAEREIFAEPPEEVRQMLGLRPNELFRILKAVYGLLHAPRAWADKLGKELKHQGWIQSKLEPCCWRLYDDHGRLCGLLGIHVDDVLCRGKGIMFEDRVQVLRESFPFGSWQSLRDTVTFCGRELRQLDDGSIELNQERYGEGINEIPLTKLRKEQPDAEATEAERKAFRAALGALSWRATQSAPWLAASVSFLQGCFKTARVGDLIQANKLIRTQKVYSQQVLHFPSDIQKPILMTYHDASYACRRDGSSQGGIFSMLVDQSVLEGKPSSFAPLGWQSKKLGRVCRSSTAAEIQTGSNASDVHEFTKHILLELFNQHPISPRDIDQAASLFTSIVVTDSKNLYDSVNRIETSGLQLEERRLALEVLSIRERAQASGMQLCWVDSDQMLADNLSKPFAFTNLLLALQKGQLSLRFDSSFTSARKKRAWSRQQNQARIPETEPGSHLEKSFHLC